MSRTAAKQAAGSVDVLIIGAGHSGLAMSRFLSARSIDHVILERGEVANSWKTERWNSLKLLTPNWQSRLPGFVYSGPEPDGYISRDEVVRFIERYASFASAPIRNKTEVTSVRQQESGYRVETSRGAWHTRAVVIASGAFNIPVVPAVSKSLPGRIRQLTPHDYRDPEQLEEGGVLVVGASATGLQLATEIQRSGRPVTLAVGEHVRMPRVYRGMDIQYWMHVVGLLDQRYDEVDDIKRARGVPSPQLVGTNDRKTLDLNALGESGVRISGRLVGVRDGKAQFSGSLRNVCKLADLKMNRMLAEIDEWIASNGCHDTTDCIERFAPTAVDDTPLLGMDLGKEGVRTVLWATGFRPDYSWLDVPVLDRKGRIQHDGGVADAPGMYVLGLPYLRRRKSSFMHGAEDDARDLSDHLARYLDVTARYSRVKIAV
jgi:putative flavoprotein involved in K+ transport